MITERSLRKQGEEPQPAAPGSGDGANLKLGMKTMDERRSRATGLAALSACEALALALVESGALDRETAARAMEDAVAAHRNAEREAPEPEMHRAAAELVRTIQRTLEMPYSALAGGPPPNGPR